MRSPARPRCATAPTACTSTGLDRWHRVYQRGVRRPPVRRGQELQSQNTHTDVHRVPLGPTTRPDITTGPDGALWFTDTLHQGAIGRITTSGVVTYSLLPDADPVQHPTGKFPFSITAGSDGAVWFTELWGSKSVAFPGTHFRGEAMKTRLFRPLLLGCMVATVSVLMEGAAAAQDAGSVEATARFPAETLPPEFARFPPGCERIGLGVQAHRDGATGAAAVATQLIIFTTANCGATIELFAWDIGTANTQSVCGGEGVPCAPSTPVDDDEFQVGPTLTTASLSTKVYLCNMEFLLPIRPRTGTVPQMRCSRSPST